MTLYAIYISIVGISRMLCIPIQIIQKSKLWLAFIVICTILEVAMLVLVPWVPLTNISIYCKIARIISRCVIGWRDVASLVLTHNNSITLVISHTTKGPPSSQHRAVKELEKESNWIKNITCGILRIYFDLIKNMFVWSYLYCL